MRNEQGGYVTLIGFLIAMAVIGFMLYSTYLTAPSQRVPDTNPEQHSTATVQKTSTTLEQYREEIDTAHEVQNIIDTSTLRFKTGE